MLSNLRDHYGRIDRSTRKILQYLTGPGSKMLHTPNHNPGRTDNTLMKAMTKALFHGNIMILLGWMGRSLAKKSRVLLVHASSILDR